LIQLIRGIKKRPDFSKMEDAELLSLYLINREEKIFETLVDRYSHLVYAVCYKYLKNEEDSKDAAMNIFGELFSDIAELEIKNFKAWLYTTTRNYCLMQLRKTKVRERYIQYEGNNQYHFVENEAEKHLIDKEHIQTIASLSEAIESLNVEQRDCIKLMYLEDKSYQDISDLTGYSLNQVKSYIQNGKRNLKIKLSE